MTAGRPRCTCAPHAHRASLGRYPHPSPLAPAHLARMSDFYQDPPRLGNQYDDDALLRSYLRWRLPAEVLAEIEPGLRALGARAAGDLLALGDAAEAEPPRHVPYDA